MQDEVLQATDDRCRCQMGRLLTKPDLEHEHQIRDPQWKDRVQASSGERRTEGRAGSVAGGSGLW